MQSEHYVTAYDALTASATATRPIVAVGLVVITAVACVYLLWSLRTASPMMMRIVGYIFVCSAGAVLIFVELGLLREFRHVRRASTSSSIRIREGVVREFRPGDLGGHLDEQWVLVNRTERHAYRYRESVVTPGYRKPRPNGGFIREGLRVRVWDLDGNLMRIDTLAQTTRQASASSH
jgi:ABC-type nickel/cobalt efflux system permease component RcnA